MKTFSLTSFLIGLLSGAIVTIFILGIVAVISIGNMSAGQGYSDGVLNNIVNQAISDREDAESKSVYGEVISISSSEIVLKAQKSGKTNTYTFIYDDSTNFTTYLRDDASTEVNVSPNTVSVGDMITVTSDQSLHSDGKHRALSVIEI